MNESMINGPSLLNPPFFYQTHFWTFSSSATSGAAEWLRETGVGTGSFTVSATAQNGRALIESGASANDTAIISLPGEPILVQRGRAVSFKAKFQMEDADQDQCFVGVSERGGLTNGSVLAKIATAIDGFGFYQNHATGGTATLRWCCGNGTSQTTGSTGVILADGTDVTVEARYVGQEVVRFYVNGVEVGQCRDTLPSAQGYSFFIQERTLDTGADYISVDYAIVHSNADNL